MLQVLLTFPFPEKDLERFADLEGCSFRWKAELTAEDVRGVDVILGQPPVELLRTAADAGVKWIQATSAGIDPYLAARDAFAGGMMLTTLSGAFGQSISEFILAMVLNLYKHLPLYRDQQRLHSWNDLGRQDSPVGKDLLILGAGNIGTATARLFRPFGCHITGMRRTMRAIPPEYDRMITIDELDDALEQADIVVCALPETDETHGLLSRSRLMRLKSTAILINVGRGALIDTDALTELLQKGVIRGAALDVTAPEPLPKEHPLWDCANAIITPHITGGSFGHLTATEERLYGICRTNLQRYLAGEPLMNLVDFKRGY